MRPLVVIIALAGCVLLGACVDEPQLVVPFDPTTIEADMPAVMAALRAGEPTEALAELDRLAGQGLLPDGATHYRALALADAGLTDEALAAWDAEVTARPGNAHAHTLLADMLIDLGRLDDAGRHIAAAQANAPELQALALIAGRHALLTERDDDAARHFRDYLESDPYGVNAAEAHHQLGQIATRRNDPRAEGHFRTSAYLERVHQYLNRYRQVLAATPEDSEARFGVAAIYLDMFLELGQDPQLIEQAEAALSAVIDVDPDHARALFNLGYVRTMQKRDVEAEEFYRRAISVDPDHWDARLNLAKLLRRNLRDDEAIALMHEIVARADEDQPVAQAHVVLAEIHDTAGRHAEALGHAQAYLALFPEDPAELGERMAQLEALLDPDG